MQFGVGLEGVDIEVVRTRSSVKFAFAIKPMQATALGIYVANIPSRTVPNALSCAEMAIFLMLALARDLHSMHTSIATRQLGAPCGQTLFGAHALIIGFGGLAMELIPRLSALGMTLSCARAHAAHWHDSTNSAKAARQADVARLLQRRGGVVDLPSMLPEADYVVLTCAQVLLLLP